VRPTPLCPRAARQITCLFLAVGIMAGVAACSGSSPTGPGGGATPSVGTYVGTLSVPGDAGLGGLLLLKKNSSFMAGGPAPGRWLAGLLDLVEPRLLAQSAATGTLVTDAGPVVALTGTFNSTTFTMSGGGYSISATVNGATISGTGTAPGGAVAQVENMAPSVPPVLPANPSGTYRSSFQANPLWTFKIVRADNGVVQANCKEPRNVSGDVSIRLSHDTGSTWDGQLLVTWTERPGGPATGFGCGAAGTTNSFGPFGIDFRGTIDVPLVFVGGETTLQNGFTYVRTLGFVGVVNGNSLDGRFWIGFSRTGNVAGPPAQAWTEGYPVTNVSLSLSKS